MQRYAKTVLRTMALGLVLSIGSHTAAFADEGAKKPLVIEEQGSFTVGGAYKERPPPGNFPRRISWRRTVSGLMAILPTWNTKSPCAPGSCLSSSSTAERSRNAPGNPALTDVKALRNH